MPPDIRSSTCFHRRHRQVPERLDTRTARTRQEHNADPAHTQHLPDIDYNRSRRLRRRSQPVHRMLESHLVKDRYSDTRTDLHRKPTFPTIWFCATVRQCNWVWRALSAQTALGQDSFWHTDPCNQRRRHRDHSHRQDRQRIPGHLDFDQRYHRRNANTSPTGHEAIFTIAIIVASRTLTVWLDNRPVLPAGAYRRKQHHKWLQQMDIQHMHHRYRLVAPQGLPHDIRGNCNEAGQPSGISTISLVHCRAQMSAGLTLDFSTITRAIGAADGRVTAIIRHI